MVTTEPQVSWHPALIGGEFRGARSEQTLDATDPATGELLGRFPRCGAQDVQDAVAAAAAAFETWRYTEIAERATLLLRFAEVLDEHGEELARLDSSDNGSPVRMMRGDVRLAVNQLRYFAGVAPQLRGATIPVSRNRLNYTSRRPYGVVGRIIPFNHPMMFAATKIAAPLMSGNTVVLKPSEHTSLSALRLGALLNEIFPAGVINVVPGLGAEAGDALVTDPRVHRLAFIGSAENGRLIQRRAAETGVKHVSLELGGKNPLVVFPDADVELVVDGAIHGMNFAWQGQSCGSTSRLLLHREIHDEVVEQLIERISQLRVGLPLQETTDMGAIVNPGQYEKVTSYIALGCEEGAELLTGGDRPQDPELASGLFIRPAVFDRVEPESRLAQEEIFGPVLAVSTFDGYDDALRAANGVRYGLTASVFTSNLETAHRFADDVDAGYVWVNDSSRHTIGAPFGGVKDSGVGREEGFEELESYTQLKNVHVRLSADS